MLKTFTLFAGVFLAAGTLAVNLQPIAAQAYSPSPQAVIAACDMDKNGTIDENEFKTAAGALFDKLDADRDRVLSERELQGRMTNTQFREADLDNDKSLNKNEYLMFAGKVFRATDRDNDSLVGANELTTPAGKVLILLIQ
jgi:hypothetical protein